MCGVGEDHQQAIRTYERHGTIIHKHKKLIPMALILSTKKLQSLLEKTHEPFLVFSHNASGTLRVAGMTEYLEEEKPKGPSRSE